MSVRTAWEGRSTSNHSLEIVNREILARLRHHSEVDLCRTSDVNITVRHAWPLDPHPPEAGRWVVMQPWEYGSIPQRWLDLFHLEVDEIWVYSEFNRTGYIEEGIPAERVRAVPLGVGAPFLRSESAAYPFRSEHGYRFLFVGASILRKGIDLLLDAYTSTFSPADDVCLVIKDFGTDSYYRNQNHAAQIRELQRDPSAPAIEYIDAELSVDEMHSLYRSCDALVHPYRGEGFGLPIAEAMASGLPVIVTDRGGASDFCTSETAILLPSRRRPITHRLAPDLATASPAHWMEPDTRALGSIMLEAFAGTLDLSAVAARGQRLVRERFSWEHTAAVVAGHIERLAALDGPPIRADRSRQHQILVEDGARRWENGDVEGALTRFGRAAELDRNPDILFNLAAATSAMGDYRSAGRLLDELQGRGGGILDADAAALREMVEEQAGNGCACEPVAPTLRWRGAVYTASGYADESRNFLLGLLESRSGPTVYLDAVDRNAPVRSLDPAERATLERLSHTAITGPVIEYQHVTPEAIERPTGRCSVLRTMFETDGLPARWAERCNLFDQVWVPSEFNVETFARSGVVREKLRVVHGCFDPRKFERASLIPRKMPGARSFCFLSVFDFSPRKGWDVLLRAYAEEFSPEDDVTLVMKVTRFIAGLRTPEEQVRAFLTSEGHTRLPHFVLIDDALPEPELLGLYAACDAFVLPSRGEGWGRPYMEAMALGLPTIGTRWSANLEFMNDDNSFLVDIDGLEPCDLRWDNPLYQGQRWAAPSVRSLREQMRRVVEDPAVARARGERAREDMARFDRAVVGQQLSQAFSALRQPITRDIQPCSV